MSFIKTINLIFHYHIFKDEKEEAEEKTVINDLSLSIDKGDFVGILGSNGSGKSTLAKQLTALLRPSSGVVYIKGKNTASADDTLAIRKTVGIIFQNPDNQLIGSTVEEDVAFGLENLGLEREEMWSRIADALSATGMSAFRMTDPGSLSGGQKQRVAISGILAMEPECIVFDEPTAMLDPAARQEIRRAVRYLNQEKNITVIYITHHIDEVEDADYLYVMNQGRLAMQGTPQELWARTKEFAANGVACPFIQALKDKLRESGLDLLESLNGEAGLNDEGGLLKHLAGRMDPDRLLFGMGARDADENKSGVMDSDESKLEAWESDVVEVERVISEETDDPSGIRLENISYHYPAKGADDQTYALKNVSLTVRPGEFLALVGQTGSGKSTLLQHMNGLLKASEGTCYFQGENVYQKDYSMKQLRQKVALCFQYPEYQLFEETVIKDICFGPANMGLPEEDCIRKARKAMSMMGLSPDLEDTSPFALSGGQKRRVALAGILAMEPDYLILDEPAAGLDQEGKEILFGLLKRLNRTRNTTIIMASHDMNDVAALADRVLVLKDGRILTDRAAGALFMDRELLKQADLEQPDCLRFYCKLMDEFLLKNSDGRVCEKKGSASAEKKRIPKDMDMLAEMIMGFIGDTEGREG